MKVFGRKYDQWPDGKIEIKLQNNKDQYMTGSVIRGKVIVTQTKDFMASELVVGIHGSEQTYFTANS